MTTTPESTIPTDFDLLDYINSGSIATRQVVLYADEQSGRDLARILDELAILGWSEVDAPAGGSRPRDEPLSGQSSEVEDLLVQAYAAQERLDASRSVWTVQALSTDTSTRIIDAHPLPKPPTPPKESAGERERERYQDRWLAYRETADKVQREQRYALLARAVVTVETPHGTAEGVTIAQLHAIDARPGGQKWIDKLWAALDEAQAEDPDVPRPTWLGRSTNSPA